MKTIAAAFGFWTLLALWFGFSRGLAEISEGYPPTWERMLIWSFTNYWLWMLLVPLVAWLGRNTANRDWRRFCLVHIPAGFVVALAQVLVRISVFWELCGPREPSVHTLGQYLQNEFVYNFSLAVLTYWIILAVLRGMESRRHLRDERLRSARLETELVQSQLQALRMQLRPHFLFNTLNAISALALADPSQAKLMIARLSDLLRLTLEEHQSQQVPLSRELEFLRCYLDIQQIRFRDRLHTHIDAAEDTLDAVVPSMILQPLAENALRHGLLAKTTRGSLVVTARRDGDYLHVRLDDDGLGLPPEGVVEGIGLNNTRARLNVLFGTTARLELYARKRGGTRVDLRVPFQVVADRKDANERIADTSTAG
ncbi:MAG: sensor histidine kinase [Rhodanobacteraceae bacterium]